MTLEANPERRDARAAARLSRGRRQPSELRRAIVPRRRAARLSRLHSRRRAPMTAFRMARAAGFDNISLDLMMWLPQQTVGEWLESVDALIALGPDHASLYMLEIYPNAPLRDAMARAQVVRGARRRRGGHVPAGRWSGWTSAGYEQYEISNVATAGRALPPQPEVLDATGSGSGSGCGAHSTRRRRPLDENVSRHGRSTSSAVMPGGSRLGTERAAAVRRRSGWRRRCSPGYACPRGSTYEEVEAALRRGLSGPSSGTSYNRSWISGWLIYDDGRLRLTRAGMLLAHEVMAVFITSTVR